MPVLSRWFVKTAMLYFLSGFTLGGWLLSQAETGRPPLASVLQPVYWHLLLVGWLMQLIFGVAYWMFPSFSKEHPHRSPLLGWLTYAGLNIGLLLRIVIEPWHSLAPQRGLGWLLIPSAILQVLASWLFLVNLWPRIRGPRR